MYYFNNIYIEGGRNQREVLREWKKERMRGRTFLSFSQDTLTWSVRSLIGFIIWTPITHLKDE